MKNLVSPAGIEPAAFRFLAQHLNHCLCIVLCSYLTERDVLLGILLCNERNNKLSQNTTLYVQYTVFGSYSYNTTNEMHKFLKFILGIELELH